MVAQVASGLRESIFNGTVVPGTRLTQEQVAEGFGVSRTPVREAFRILAAEGLLQVVAKSNSADVVKLDAHDELELYEIREVIDGLAARLASTNASDEELSQLSAAFADLSSSCDPFRKADFLSSHASFHLAIMRMSGNSRLRQFEVVVRISSQMVYPRLEMDLSRVRTAMSEHQKILDAIVKRDAVAAESAARSHITAAIASWIRP